MSTIVTSNISDGTDTVGTEYVVNGSAKAWVNFNGTGTVAIRESFKVSSMTDNGTGDYTINFSSALADANYAVSLCGGRDFTDLNAALYPSTTPTSSSVRINTYANDASATRVDPDYVYAIIVR